MRPWTTDDPPDDQLRVVVPNHPPVLNPAAAQAMLALLIHLANAPKHSNDTSHKCIGEG
jgi:hypothetical protein